MNIALAANDDYVQHLGVTLASILANAAPDTTVNAYILSDDLSDESVRRLVSLADIRSYNLHLLQVDPGFFEGCLVTRHTVMMYFRLRLPELLPQESKVIYFDCDTIVRDSLQPLWSIDLGHAPFGASPDALSLIGSPAQQRMLNRSGPTYYNSGVLLMNLERMREDQSGARLVQWIRQHSGSRDLQFPDQDAINAVYGEEIVPLSIEWNYQFPLFNHRELVEGEPKVIHFTTQNKPWKYMTDSEYKHEYWHYLALTPWNGALPEGKSVGAKLRKALRVVRPPRPHQTKS